MQVICKLLIIITLLLAIIFGTLSLVIFVVYISYHRLNRTSFLLLFILFTSVKHSKEVCKERALFGCCY